MSSASFISHLSAPQLLGAVLAAASISWILYSTFLHPLRNVPGPALARYSEIWRTYRYWRGSWHSDILDVHKQYGPVVRIAPNEVSVVDESIVGTIFSHSKGGVKTGWYNTWVFGPRNADTDKYQIFVTQCEKTHGFSRRRVSNLYSMSSVVQWEGPVQDILDSLWKKFDEFADRKETFDMHKWASFFAFDVVSMICNGTPSGFVSQGEDVDGFIASVHSTFHALVNVGNMPGQALWVHNLITRFVLKLLDLDLQKHFVANAQLCIDMIKSREEQQSKGVSRKRNMLDSFLQLKTQSGEPAPIGHVMSEMGNILSAGGDTTSVALRSVLGPLLQDKARYEKLQKEIDEAYARWHSEGHEGEALPFSIAKDLPYLTACTKEGTRLRPSIVYQLPREVPAQGVQVAGYNLSSGVTVSVSPLAQNRSQSVFGAVFNVDEFIPERWMRGEGSTPEQIKKMEKIDATFGYGSRTCIGKNIAIFEMAKFISQLIYHYDIWLANPERPWVMFSAWTSFQKEMHLGVRRRRSLSRSE